MGKAKAAAAKGPSKKTVEKKKDKVIEDKTFGLKNKNKSKKVQEYIKQVTTNSRSGNMSADALARKQAEAKKEKEMQKEAEKEMLALLGEAYALSGKKNKAGGKSKTIKKAEEKLKQEKEEEAQKAAEIQKEADERDFGVPVCALRDAFGLGSKAVVERLCVELVHKDNLIGKAHDGSQCYFIKIDDGTTRNPMMVTILGETPQTFPFKVGQFLDIRQSVAMVRGANVYLELPKGTQGLTNPVDGVDASVRLCSDRLSEYIKERMAEEIAIRERGGIPIEERIEEERANLTGTLTPVTKERFFAWKEKRQKAKEAERERLAKESKKTNKGTLTGRALFAVNSSIFVDDEAAVDNNAYALRDENEPPEAPEHDEGEELSSAIQEQLYLEGDDEDLDDLDDLSDDDE